MGVTLIELGHASEAEKHFRRTIEINPQYVNGFINMANLMVVQKRHKEALVFFQNALKIKPNSSIAHLGLGNALQQLGRYVQALQSVEQALSIDPNMSSALHKRHQLLNALQNKGE